MSESIPFAYASELDSRSSDKDAAIEAASGVVRDICGWHVFPSVAETVRVRGSGASVVMLPTLHLTGVTAVRVDGAAVSGFTWHAAGYLSERVTRGAVEVDIIHGYASPPPGLVDVVLAIAERIMANPTSATTERLGDYSVGYGGLTDLHRSVLARYTIPGWS